MSEEDINHQLRSTFRTPVRRLSQPEREEDQLASLNDSFGTMGLGSRLYGSLSSLFRPAPTPQSATPRRTLEDIRADVVRQQQQHSFDASAQNFADRTSNTLQRIKQKQKERRQNLALQLQQQASLSDVSLGTADISLVSHAHGRQRRSERNIQRKELQAAIKYGRKETANPGRDGSHRWRYTYNGVVFITDETSRHEVTSWRIDGKDEEDAIAPAEMQLAGSKCHAVLIVDHSGSMRNADVPGYETRAHAVYECLKRDFVGEQLKAGAANDVIVSIISMSDAATLELHKKPLDASLINDLQRLSRRRPRSHGNYIPALDKALELMKADAAISSSLLLLFFSDGAPSDHQFMQCSHGIEVFEVDRNFHPKMLHVTKQQAWRCIHEIHKKVEKACCDRVKSIGQVFGRDKVVFRTLAFGPPRENFRLMETMANVLPRGEFQKLELNAASLRTSFSSLSSSLSTLRTEGGHRALTRRSDKVVDRNQKVDITSASLSGRDGWWVYAFDDLIGKYEFKTNRGKLQRVHFLDGANGIAFLQQPFADGAERFVFRCSEVAAISHNYDYAAAKGNRADRRGLRLVAKEAKDLENHHKGRKFHETFARIQSEAAELAQAFTLRLPHARPEWSVNFIKTQIYGCYDNSYKFGQAWILVEPELDGKFTKWNNNAGVIRAQTSARGKLRGTGIGMNFLEDLEESNENDDGVGAIQIDDVPQAFSHFSYEHSGGRQLVCDLQGVWNADDGFVLTDPVIHHVSLQGHRHVNGATDQGEEGVKKFFDTHVCNSLCKRMRLSARSPDTLIPLAGTQFALWES